LCGSALTYGEIAARSGVGRASICRWTRDGGWQRPAFAPRATDTVPTARASAKLKSRKLAARLFALADRYVRELEETPGADLDKLAEALELLKMAKLATMGRRRRRRDTAVAQGMAIRQAAPPQAPMRPIAQLCAGDVDLHRAPRPAVDDFLENRDPPRDEPGPHGRRGRRSQRDDHHAWMLRKE
jgi:hypothetical protein